MTVPQKVPEVSAPSLMSLKLVSLWNANELGSGTAFVVSNNSESFLITNWHNVAGRNLDTRERFSSRGVTPDQIAVLHNDAHSVGTWQWVTHDLLDDQDRPLWLVHPRLGNAADLVALPLDRMPRRAEVSFMPYSLEEALHPMMLKPSLTVSIVGFPFGLASNAGIGIWAQGSIASEPELDYDDKPMFLIDSRTRPGQSGSPVISFFGGGSLVDKTGNMFVGLPPQHELLGIYSGRINSESDIGRVWKTEAILETVQGGIRDHIDPSWP